MEEFVMLCQYCGKNPAAIHVKSTENGELTEFSLCAECAQELGYGNLFTGLGLRFNGVLREFFSQDDNEFDTVRCKCCGASFSDIVKSGKVGCSACYDTFYDRLVPLLQQIHGSAVHRGKTTGESLPQIRPKGQLSIMHRKLREAIESEDFESAALLRDSIRKLEEGGEKDE
jgi:protein arginine kinase activator